MFLCLHASGLTLIPVSIIAIRASLNAANPTDIFIPCMIATFAATMAAMLIVSFKQKINIFQPVILLWVLRHFCSYFLDGYLFKNIKFYRSSNFFRRIKQRSYLLIFFCIILGHCIKTLIFLVHLLKVQKEALK